MKDVDEPRYVAVKLTVLVFWLLIGVLVEAALLVFVVQPDTNKEATTSNRTIIAVIGFNCIMLSQEANVGLTVAILSSRIQSRVPTCLSIIVPNMRRLCKGLKCE